MSTNVSKQKRDELIAKIDEIRKHLVANGQDQNANQLITYLAEIEREINGKK